MSAIRANRRNANGVKDSIDLYRTFNGHEYVAWLSYPSQDRIDKYRKAGIRCRRLGVELFVHYADIDEAKKIYATESGNV